MGRAASLEDNDYSNRVVIIMKQLKSVVSWHESLVSSEIDLIEADGRTDQMEGFADTLKALQKSLQQFYQVLQDAFLLPGDTTSGMKLIKVYCSQSKYDFAKKDYLAWRNCTLLACARNCRSYCTSRGKAATICPKAVRAACMEVEKNIFQVSSVAERFVECSRDLWKLYFQSPSTKIRGISDLKR